MDNESVDQGASGTGDSLLGQSGGADGEGQSEQNGQAGQAGQNNQAGQTGQNDQAGQTGQNEQGDAQGEQGAEPDSYAPFTTPEGTTPIDEETHAELAQLGKTLGLNQQQMQTLVDFGAKKIGDGMEAARLEIFRKRAAWREEAQKDPEIAKDIDHAYRLVKEAGDEELKTVFNETGIGDNPVFIRFCIRAGKLLGEDAFIRAEKGGSGNPESILSIAHNLYPDMKK
jgi:hypothetical protein